MTTQSENIPPNVQSLEELEESLEDAFSSYREQRIEEMKKALLKSEAMKQTGHGTYTAIPHEKEFLQLVTNTKKVVCHFWHTDFRRSKIMDQHLETIASRHFGVRFVKLNVENAPFLVEKLAVRTLPCVISFEDGIAIDRIVGFADLGNTDNFTSARLELRLAQSNIIKVADTKTSASLAAKKRPSKSILGSNSMRYADEDDEDD